MAGPLQDHVVLQDARGRLWAGREETRPDWRQGFGDPRAITRVVPVYGPVDAGSPPNGDPLHDALCALARGAQP